MLDNLTIDPEVDFDEEAYWMGVNLPLEDKSYWTNLIDGYTVEVFMENLHHDGLLR